MRRILGVSCLFFLAACGGGTADSPTDPTGPPPPPPPPAPTIGPPASIAVQQGDGQVGEPGVALATHPAVVVKDANSRVVPNVAVTFAVDSGGGSIESGVATTGADGIATSGNWTLGSAEGRNTLNASVTGVTPVTLAATARIPDVSVAQGQASQSGGEVTVNRPGTALDGFRIEIPDSAYPGGISITIRQSSSAGLTLQDPGQPPIGSRALRVAQGSGAVGELAPATPVITIVSTGSGTANGILLLRIPVPPNTIQPIVAVVDSLGHPVTFLPIVASDASSVTVSTGTLSTQVLQQIGNLPQPIGNGPHTLSIVIFKGAGGGKTLAQQFPYPIATGYTFGKHNFTFGDYPTTASNRLGSGMVWAEYVCYVACPNGVHGTTERAPGIPASDRQGIITSAGLENDLTAYMGRYSAAYMAYYRSVAVPTSMYDFYVGSNLIYLLYYGQTPVPLMLTDGTYWHMVLVTAWDPSSERFIVREPFYGNPAQLLFPNGNMTPYPDPLYPTIQYHTAYVNYAWLSGFWPTAWQRMASLRAGGAGPEPYPGMMHPVQVNTWSPILRGAGPDDPDSIFVLGDTTRVWQSTQGATTGYPSVLPVGSGWLAQDGYIFLKGASAWGTTPGHNLSFFFDWSAYANGVSATYGMDVAEGVAGSALQRWAGWREFQMVRYGISISANVKTTGTLSTFTPVIAAGSPVPPSNAQYEWDFGDGSAKVTITGPTAATHTYNANGSYTVTLKVWHPTESLQVAEARKTINSSGVLLWRFTQFSAPDRPVGGGSGTLLATGYARFTPQGGVNNQDHVTWWKADSTLIIRLRSQPYTGLLVYLPAPVTVGATTYRAGLYLQSDPTGTPGQAAQFDPTQQLIILAQTPGPPYPDVYPPPQLAEPYADSVSVTSVSDNSAINGAAINQIRDFTGLAAVVVAPQKKRVLLAWNETMVLNGTLATGTLVRTQSLWSYFINTAAHGMYWDNLFNYTMTFEAVRTP